MDLVVFSMFLLCFRLCRSGFEQLGMYSEDLNASTGSGSSHGSRVNFQQDPRVTLNSGFLIEALNGVYFAL